LQKLEREISFKKHKFSDFFVGPVFFIAIRLTICEGVSAPHFAANAVLSFYMHGEAVAAWSSASSLSFGRHYLP
jgi:hypothetical protein